MEACYFIFQHDWKYQTQLANLVVRQPVTI